MPDSLTLLEAVTILRQRKPDDVSAEELAALRTCFESNPALAGMVGGAGVVERYIAEVEAAIERQEAAAKLAENAAPAKVAAAQPRNHRRIVELSVYVVLLLAGASGLYFLLARDTSPSDATRSAAVNQSTAATQSTADDRAQPGAGDKTAATTQPASQESGDSAEPTAPPDDPNLWRGWRMSCAPDVNKEKKTEWDRTDPSNPEPADALLVRGGPLMLTRDIAIEPDMHWLMVHARPNTVAIQPGQIVVAMDGKEIAKASIGAGQSDWPLYVSVSASQGAKRHFEVTFQPANAKQEVTFWNLQFVESQRRKSQPESHLIVALRAADPATRAQGAVAAGTVPDLFVVHALVGALKDPQPSVRRAACTSLAKYTHDDCAKFVAESLTAALKDTDQEVRKIAATSLMAFSTNTAGAAALAGAMNDRDPQVRQTAATAIMSFKGDATWDVLRKAMLEHPDYDLRLQIANQLIGQKDPKTLAAYVELISSPDDRLRVVAASALGQIQNPEITAKVIQALADPEPGVRRTVAQILCQHNDPASEAALRSAISSHPDPLIRRIALTYLRTRATSADLPAIRDALKSPDVALRRLAPAALLSIDDAESHTLLAQMLDDADEQVRSQAAETLIRKRGDQADEILLKVLASHPDPAVRTIAMTRFFMLSPVTPRAVGLLRELTKHPVSTVRSGALNALGNIRSSMVERVKQLQAEALRKDPQSPRVREEIQKALAQSPGPEILAAVVPLLDDPTVTVVESAANMFANDPTLAANSIIFGTMAKSQNVLLRRRAALHFANSEWIVPTAEYREPLLALLKDADPETRRWALKSLVRLPAAETKALAEQHLDDPSYMVREIAAVALGKNPATITDDAILPPESRLGGPQAVSVLVGLLQSPRASIRQAAATRLAESPEPAAEEALLQALASNSDVGVRRVAAARFASRFPTPKVVGPARAALAIPDVQLRVDTLLALSKTPTHPDVFAMIAPLVQDADMNVRLAAATVLAQNVNAAGEEVAIKLIQSGANSQTLQQAIARLGLLPSARGMEVLKSLLGHREVEVRIAALNAVSRLKDPSVIPIIATGLADADTLVRQHAATLLTGRTEPAINDILLQALSSHADPAVRRVVATWCHHRPKAQSIGPLRSCIQNGDDALRVTVLQALSNNPAPAATEGIVQLVSDPVYEVWMGAAATLTGRRDAVADAAALMLLAAGSDIEIRRLMANRFQNIPSPPAAAALVTALKDADDQLRQSAALALRHIPGAEATEALVAALADPNPNVRKAAHAALSQRQDPRAQAAAKEYQAKLTAGG